MKLSEIGIGEVLRDGEFDWLGLTAEMYEGKHHLTFLISEKFIEEINHNLGVSCVITLKEIANKVRKDIGVLVVANPKQVFFEFHNKLANTEFYNKKNIKNIISEKAVIADSVKIRGNNVIIEEGVIIDDYVVIYSDVHIRKNSIIRAGVVIGSQPFEFVRNNNDVIQVQCIGNIDIGEQVEILPNTVVEKAVFGTTKISKNVKIDSIVHIAHDTNIGENSFIVSGSVIGGRTRLGKNSYTGINASVKNGLYLGENSTVSMGAVVSKNVTDNQTVTGNLAIEHSKFMENLKKIIKGEGIEKNMGN